MPLLRRKVIHSDHYSKSDEGLQDDPEKILSDLLADNDMTPMPETDADVFVGLDFYFPDAAPWSKKVTSDSEKPLSKKVTRRRRRSNDRDAQVIKAIQQNELRAPRAQYPSLVGTLQPLISTPSTPQNQPVPTPCNENARPPAWVFTSDRAKLFAANRALTGVPYALSLNLGLDQEKAALASPKGFSAYMRGMIVRALQRELGYVPLFWFVVDTTSQGRLHLHGGIVCDDNVLNAIERALRHAGGDWASRKHHERQLDLTPQTDLDGWVDYALGNMPKVRRLISGKGVVISNPLRKLAQALYENKLRNQK
ncbi:hypothetical protein [Bradyrhizobium sp. S69]|uniref:hypothetical protein n=1 Tax=Bradyrhizobium sp. S69 TaxID=1641856 RepID=UPI00131AC522|nr:hypothetical protein [Bradyrhizobium sp. S69]